MQEVFGRLNEHNFELPLGKCWFFHTQVEYLGHMIYLGGLGIQHTKVEAISQVLQPIVVSRLRTLLGLCNYYQRFVKGFNSITKPLI